MNNGQPSELERRVDEVLFYMWDPLGFKGEPFTRNEYRSYVQGVFGCLEQSKTSTEVENLLIDIVEKRMGLNFSREIARHVGKILYRHKKSIDAENSP